MDKENTAVSGNEKGSVGACVIHLQTYALYAHDREAGEKRRVASTLVAELWETGNGVLSTQVLQELYVNVTRKIPLPLPPAQARSIVEDYLAWRVELNGPESVLRASEIEERYRLSFWDALIVAAAVKAKAEKILTEDLSNGQRIERVLIQNPFFDTANG